MVSYSRNGVCRSMRSSLFAAAFAATSLAGFAVTAHADEPPFGVNLVQNPGAEAGVNSVDGQVAVPIPGWSVTGDMTVASYLNTAGLPVLASVGSPNRGVNFFFGGPTSTTATIQQIIPLTAFANYIDEGRGEFLLSGWLGGTGTQDDSAIVIAVFNDALGDSLSTVNIAGPTSAARGGVSGMRYRSRSGTIPAECRSVSVIVLASRIVAPTNDGCADDLSLVITEGFCPADWDQDVDVDSDDIVLFFGDWEMGEADVDGDDDTDSDDIVAYFVRWENGC